jgi:hypothetical protein
MYRVIYEVVMAAGFGLRAAHGERTGRYPGHRQCHGGGERDGPWLSGCGAAVRSGDSGEGEHYSEGKPNTIPVIANTIGAKRRWQSDCA